MALIKTLKPETLSQVTDHFEVECTYSILTDSQGNRCLQLDTYGSRERQIVGKKSQSLRLAPEAIRQLKAIIADNGL